MTELLCAAPRKTLDAFLALDLIAWCQAYRKEVRPGIPYTFNEPWLEEIYTDQSREKVIMKAAQVRISEYLISEALWRIDTAAWSVFYAFPAFAKMSDFVKSRVGPALTACPKMRARLQTDEVRIKTFGAAALYFSGAQTEDQVTTANADLVIRDEFEFIPPEVRPAILKRLGDSSHAEIRDVSHPRFPGAGIAARYEDSDRREWHVRCQACGQEQALAWERVRFTEATAELCRNSKPVPSAAIYIACQNPKCGQALDRGGPGRWIRQNPDSAIAGFHVSKLMRPQTDLAAMVRQSREAAEFEIQAFYNYDLGLPYSPKGMNITREMLDALVSQDYHLPSAGKFTFMGVDVGRKLHVWIERQDQDGKQRPLFIGTVDQFQDLNPLLPRFGVRVAVVDALPETRAAREWADAHKRTAAICYFQGRGEKKADIVKFDDADAVATVHRTMICDQNENDISDGRLVLPQNAATIPELFQHLQAPKRIKEKDSDGEIHVTWDSAGKADHFFFARNYALVARMLYRDHGYGRGKATVQTEDMGSAGNTREFTPGGQL